MKTAKVVLSAIFFCFLSDVQCLEVKVSSAVGTAGKLFVGLIGQQNEFGAHIEQLKHALEYTGQFNVHIQPVSEIHAKSEVTDLFKKGYGIALFISQPEPQTIEWRLYDTIEGTMYKGKRLILKGAHALNRVYQLVDDLWQPLTYEKSSCCSQIAYIKRARVVRGRTQSTICISDYDGSNDRTVVKQPGTYVGLYWDSNPAMQRLLCSEFTRSNVRFISILLDGSTNPIFNISGTCVGISLAPDNNQAVYCRSGDIWYYRYDHLNQKGIHTVLIKNDGKNIYPILLKNGDVIFCSDAKSLLREHTKARGPQICYYHTKEKRAELLTHDGYCIAPAYHQSQDKLAYCKQVNGNFQLWVCDMKKREHKQITSDGGDKMDPCWSPCGNYLVYCHKSGQTSQIATIHTTLKKVHKLTPAYETCSSPTWSPHF